MSLSPGSKRMPSLPTSPSSPIMPSSPIYEPSTPVFTHHGLPADHLNPSNEQDKDGFPANFSFLPPLILGESTSKDEIKSYKSAITENGQKKG